MTHYNVILVDASDEAVKGSKQSDYRLHYAFDLFNFQNKSMEVTSIKEGEKLGRYSIDKNDIMIADRIYCTMSGIEHVVSQSGSYVLRFIPPPNKHCLILPKFCSMDCVVSS